MPLLPKEVRFALDAPKAADCCCGAAAGTALCAPSPRRQAADAGAQRQAADERAAAQGGRPGQGMAGEARGQGEGGVGVLAGRPAVKGCGGWAQQRLGDTGRPGVAVDLCSKARQGTRADVGGWIWRCDTAVCGMDLDGAAVRHKHHYKGGVWCVRGMRGAMFTHACLSARGLPACTKPCCSCGGSRACGPVVCCRLRHPPTCLPRYIGR